MAKQTFSIGYYRAVFDDEKREGSRVHDVLKQLNKLTQQKRVSRLGMIISDYMSIENSKISRIHMKYGSARLFAIAAILACKAISKVI